MITNVFNKNLLFACCLAVIGAEAAFSDPDVLASSQIIASQAVLQDLDMMYQTILENHPGPHNQKDPDFMKNMNRAYQEAKANSVRVNSQQEAFQLLHEFAQSFCDQHLGIYVDGQTESSQERLSRGFLIESFTPDIAWVTIPNFAPNRLELAALELLIEELPKLREKQYIIFDVRGNGGGSSLWGTRILESLFTQEYVLQKFAQNYGDSFENFRVSKSNLDYWKSETLKLEDSFGRDSKEYLALQELLHGMQKAYDEQQLFYSMKITGEEPKISGQEIANPCSARIVVLIDSGCFSSCLMFIHELQTVDPTITLIGQKTATNTSYMEIRLDILPSGIRFGYPTAVGINSKPHFHYYTPDIAYPENVKDDAAIQSWLEKTIKALN